MLLLHSLRPRHLAAACRCEAPDAQSERLAARSLLPPLVAQIVRMPDCAAAQLSNTAEALASGGLRSLDADTARAVGARFSALLEPGPGDGAVQLKAVVKLLEALQSAQCEPSGELLARIGEWVAAAGAADEAAGGGQAGPGRARVLGPPVAAARLLRVWSCASWQEELPMPAVWALAHSAAEGAGEAWGGIVGYHLSATLHCLGTLVSKAKGGAADAADVAYATPSGLHGHIARWGGVAIARIVPEDAGASQDLAWAVMALHRLRVAPDAATADRAAAKAAAVAERVQGRALPAFALQIIPPLVAWHKQGLAPDLAPAAKAFAARAREWAAACKDSGQLSSCRWALRLITGVARVSLPRLPVPHRHFRQEGNEPSGEEGGAAMQGRLEQGKGG